MATLRTRLGTRGEELARRFLLDKGYQVLGTNYRCRWGEIDIVARDAEDVVFVEVRTRRSRQYGTPEESITPSKARRLTAAAQEYLQRHAVADTGWRIDLVGVSLGPGSGPPRLCHLENVVEQ